MDKNRISIVVAILILAAGLFWYFSRNQTAGPEEMMEGEMMMEDGGEMPFDPEQIEDREAF